jgi:hypothetical protein
MLADTAESTTVALLTIPPTHRPGIDALLSLPPGDVDQLVEVLSALSDAASPRAVAAHVAAHMPSMSSSIAESIVGALYSLYAVQNSMESASAELAEEVTAAAERTPLQKTVERAGREHAVQTLSKLLGISRMAEKTKALDLLSEFDRNFHSARILTDIRPVFGDDPAKPPQEAYITHTLKITYHENRDTKNSFYALDSDDLRELGEAIERAEVKERSLRKFLDSAHQADPGQEAVDNE